MDLRHPLFFFQRCPAHRDLHSFPTRRSSDLPVSIPVRTAARMKSLALAIGCVQTETIASRSEEHTSELQSRFDLVCRLLLEKKNKVRIVDEHLGTAAKHRVVVESARGADRCS